MRYEIKYILEPSSIFHFERWLLQQPLLRRAYPERRINSVYFDTCNLHTGEENIVGLSDRKKVRARWYGALESQTSDLALEIKLKHGRLGRKISHPFDADINVFNDLQVRKMKLSFQQSSAVQGLLPSAIGYLPSLYVGYLRQYYLDASGIRITIDRDLEFCDLMRKPEGVAGDQVTYRKYIVEFKFSTNVKDAAADLMRALPFYPVRSSKYLIGLSALGKALYI